MKTYSQLKKEKPIDWFKELSKPIDEYKWMELARLSQSWVTCACGSQCAIIPRDKFGTPKDEKLATLGKKFHESIMLEKRKKAISVLKKIEKRSKLLINRMIKHSRMIIKTTS